ncbi:hypothetical protein [Lacticaseibacillus pantheris]|uniref:hypothetical protein n=1 Tax=Lacticaseibacillus pantheris TaxID=171523 RepID=UPI0006CF5AB8|nr:hypothetical protein [Lacticaseibacillus pantheris]
MPSARDRILSTIALAGLSITYPILAGGTGGFVWSFQLVALVILAVVIAAVQLDWRPGWLAIVGIIPAIIGAFNQWTILPLALALLGLTYIISTQTMLHEIRTTLLIVLAGFTQIMLTMADTHVLQSSYLTALILMLIPFVVGVWSKYLHVGNQPRYLYHLHRGLHASAPHYHRGGGYHGIGVSAITPAQRLVVCLLVSRRLGHQHLDDCFIYSRLG